MFRVGLSLGKWEGEWPWGEGQGGLKFSVMFLFLKKKDKEKEIYPNVSNIQIWVVETLAFIKFNAWGIVGTY